MSEKPVGILPRKLHDERRANEIHEAVNRYLDAGLPVPIVWIEEYNEIVNHVYELTVFESHESPGYAEAVEKLRSSAIEGPVFFNTSGDAIRTMAPVHSIVHLEDWIKQPMGAVCGLHEKHMTLTRDKELVNCLQCKGVIRDLED